MIKFQKIKKVTISVPEDTHTHIKKMAFDARVSLNDLMLEFLEYEIRRRDGDSVMWEERVTPNYGWTHEYAKHPEDLKKIIDEFKDDGLQYIAAFSVFERDYFVGFDTIHAKSYGKTKRLYEDGIVACISSWPISEKIDQYFLTGVILWARNDEVRAKFNALRECEVEN